LVGILPLFLAPPCVPSRPAPELKTLREGADTDVVEMSELSFQPDSAEVLRLIIVDWMTNPEVRDHPYVYLIDPDDESRWTVNPKINRLLIDQRSVPKQFDLEIPGLNVELFDLSKHDLTRGEMPSNWSQTGGVALVTQDTPT
jgi:hypothetical protein